MGSHTHLLVKIAHINLQHARAATAQLLQDISVNGLEIISINETYLYEGKLQGFPRNYTVICEKESPRAALVVHSKHGVIILETGKDYVVISVTLGTHTHWWW